MNYLAIGALDSTLVNFRSHAPDKTSFLRIFEQRFEIGASAIDILHNDKYWETFVANVESGPCYTYNPPFESAPGKTISMYMVFNMTDWDPDLDIFLHDQNSFFYSSKAFLNNKLITADMLSMAPIKNPRAVGR